MMFDSWKIYAKKSYRHKVDRIFDFMRLKTRRLQNNPVDYFVAESPFQRVRARREVWFEFGQADETKKPTEQYL